MGVLSWRVVSKRSKVEGVHAVSEGIKMVMRLVFERMKVVVEPKGCVGSATVLLNDEWRRWAVEQQRQKGTTRALDVVIVFSRGNTTMEEIAGLFGKQKSGEAADRVKGKVGHYWQREAEDVAG